MNNVDRMTVQIDWEKLTPEERRVELFRRQKKTLELFLAKKAISRTQYDESLRGLRDKMGIQDVE